MTADQMFALPYQKVFGSKIACIRGTEVVCMLRVTIKSFTLSGNVVYAKFSKAPDRPKLPITVGAQAHVHTVLNNC